MCRSPGTSTCGTFGGRLRSNAALPAWSGKMPAAAISTIDRVGRRVLPAANAGAANCCRVGPFMWSAGGSRPLHLPIPTNDMLEALGRLKEGASDLSDCSCFFEVVVSAVFRMPAGFPRNPECKVRKSEFSVLESSHADAPPLLSGRRWEGIWNGSSHAWSS